MATKAIEEPTDGEPVIIDETGNAIPVEAEEIPTVEPSTIQFEPEASEGEKSKRKGRPKGSKNAKAQKETASDISGLLLSIHNMLSLWLEIEELSMEEKEAEALGKAVARVQSLYELPFLTEKQLAWINLAAVAGGTYGPRLAAYQIRMKKEKAGKPQTIDATGFKVM